MLTDTAIRQAKPTDKPRKLSDGGGLFVLIEPYGSKLWRQAYRFGGKQKTLAHGPYPQVSLAKARKARDAAKAVLAQGIDPGVQRKLAKHITGNTFRHVAEEVFTKAEKEGCTPGTLKRNRWALSLAYPAIGDRPISQITAPELLAACRQIEARETYETARRLRSLCSSVFRFAIVTGRAERDPAADLRGALTAPTVTHRAAITKPKQVGALLRAIDGYDGEKLTRLALQLLALTFVRPGEIRFAEWPEVDVEAAVWSIPARRTKMRLPHSVPLSKQAVTVFREIHAVTGAGRLIFPSIRAPERPMSENTLNAALRRLGYRSDEMCAHGFRSIASTLLNESGKWNPDAIERQLAHREGNGVRAAYARGEYWAERVSMMGWWARHLAELKTAAIER
jgi:integrase